MKILHINNNYPYTQLHQYMNRKLSDCNIDNTFVCPIYNKDKISYSLDSNVIILECLNKWDSLFFYRKQRKIINSVLDSIDVSSYNCIHAYTVFTDGNTAMELSKKYNIPYVVAVRNTDVNTFFKYMPHLRKKGVEILKNSSAVFFLSDSYKKQVLNIYIPKKYYDEILNKSYVIPNGINNFWHENKYENRPPFNKEKINICYAGRVEKNKNLNTTILACQILKDKGYDVEYTVVGKICDKSFLKKINKYPFINYCEPVGQEELINIYRRNDIFVMPSFYETFGLVYAEAMSQGLPVIYTKNQGFDNQFPEGHVGYHVSADNPCEIAERIIDIYNNIEEFSKNSICSIDNFKWLKICEEYKKIYEKIIM